MAILEQKFDEVKINGLLKPSALSSAISNNDELDNVGQVKTSRLMKRTVPSNVRKPQSLDVPSTLMINLQSVKKLQLLFQIENIEMTGMFIVKPPIENISECNRVFSAKENVSCRTVVPKLFRHHCIHRNKITT